MNNSQQQLNATAEPDLEDAPPASRTDSPSTSQNGSRQESGGLQKRAKGVADEGDVRSINYWVYNPAWVLFTLFFRLGGLKVHGRENVPRSGPVIIAANHVSLLDPPLVSIVLPRPMYVVAKSELFDIKVAGLKTFGYVIRCLGAFPVRRGQPDRKALRNGINVLKRGDALLIFPEGMRSPDGELHPAELGVAMIAHATKAPIVPTYLKGTEGALSNLHEKLRLIKTEVWFGEPLHFEEEYSRRGDRATLEAIGERTMREIAALRDQARSEESKRK